MEHNSYAGVDRGLATRMAAVFWMVGAVLVLTALPLTPPTEAIGNAGWAVAGASGLIALVGALLLMRRGRVSYSLLLAIGYVSVAQIALAQWLAGGIAAPYRQLYILPALAIAAVHPPRRIVVFITTLLAAAAAPLVYDGWDERPAAAFLLGALLWIGIAVMTHRLMDELRERQMESRREEDHARRLARLDPLTGLNNRRAFDETLDEQIGLARANGQSLSVLLADIDGFKQINDDHGHMNGDSCLRQVARTIQVSVRATDACFRWGGRRVRRAAAKRGRHARRGALRAHPRGRARVLLRPGRRSATGVVRPHGAGRGHGHARAARGSRPRHAHAQAFADALTALA